MNLNVTKDDIKTQGHFASLIVTLQEISLFSSAVKELQIQEQGN